MSGRTTIFYGGVVNPKTLTSYDAHPRCILAVGPSGNIEWMEDDVPAHDLQAKLAQYSCDDADLVELKAGEFLLPGFVDTHTHAPQLPNIGTGQQYELLDWLANVTFPMEAKFKDVAFARRIYKQVVRTFIDAGTTTCCYYATLHVEASKVLADTVHAYGQRGFIGKCNMNHDCPSYYIEPSPEESISNTHAVISYNHSRTIHAYPVLRTDTISPSDLPFHSSHLRIPVPLPQTNTIPVLKLRPHIHLDLDS
ncbi:hypothetical protein NMY22_g17863 [Coprinellus aureogranulatus]|nr:hypothetical protein NMY22_g17863 [Coprinellus aureogranulatus]